MREITLISLGAGFIAFLIVYAVIGLLVSASYIAFENACLKEDGRVIENYYLKLCVDGENNLIELKK